MKTLNFALRGLWRDWRGGDLRLLGLALLLAVASVTSVGFFTDRVDRALRQQGNELLAADLVLQSGDPLPEEIEREARRRGLALSRSLTFPSVVLAHGNPQLVQVKAVDTAYPLRGRLLVRDAPDGPVLPADSAPPRGQVWVEPRLMVLLDRARGDTIDLGNGRFTLARLIELEPDRGGSLFQLAPRILLNLADIPATGLVTPASRVKHRLMLAGAAPTVAAFRDWVEARLPHNGRVLGIEDARPELRTALERGGRFLALAALVAVIITGAAVALSTRRLVERQSDAVAVMRCLGAGSRFLRNALLLRLAALVMVAGGLGALAGFLAQAVLARLLGDWLVQGLPAPSLGPLVTGLGTAALTLLGFALPALLWLPKVPPLRVLRGDLGPGTPGPWIAGLAVFATLTLLLLWQTGDIRLAAAVLGGALGLITTLAGLAWLLIRLAGVLQQRVHGIARFGLASLSRHPGTTVLQVCGFGLGIMAMLLLAVVRVDLLSTWERSLPQDAPNRFLINILPEQVAALERFLAAKGIVSSGLHPMIRGRLTHINGRELDPEAYTNPRARRLAARGFNLSWAERPQSDNRIQSGSWWHSADARPQWSMESGIAETLGIRLGDRLTYWIGGRALSAPVTSLRSVQWDSFNVNFFVVGSPALLQDEAATYLSSFYLPPEREMAMGELVKEFPNVTVLDVSALMTQVRQVMARGSTAVQYVFLFTLGAGLLVLYAGIQAGAEGRRREAAILRTLGAKRRQLLGAAAVEFAVLGLLAGLLASLGAALTGWVLAHRVFDLDYGFSFWLWGAGIGGGVIGIGLAGLLAAWPLVIRPPLQSLRRAET
jgi:putative ABC transport system permease protein